MNNNITLSPHLRLTMAGCRITVKHHKNGFKVQLLRGEQVIATGTAARSGSMSNTQALERAFRGAWGPTSDFHELLTNFADIAEALVAHNPL